MTRYTRAKGSKASNERLPNDATPWYVMKQQLEENKNKKIIEKRKSAKELLKDHKNIFYGNTVGNINYDWADFDDGRIKSNIKMYQNTQSEKKFANLTGSSSNDNVHTTASKNNNNKVQKMQYTKTKKAEKGQNDLVNKKEQCGNDLNLRYNQKKLSTTKNSICSNFSPMQEKQNQKELKISSDETKKFIKDTSGKSSFNQVKKRKMREQGEYKRRKPNIGITKIMINGVATEIVKYEGFPIKKEDAERLTELKQKLMMKGIPKSEVDIAMKLERRRAEKALARAKKLVCFHCRKSGHNLSDCPELGNEICTGICFKCGSTEHTHFECKVSKDSAYRYATCFICREQGHIAAQCPDNPRGIYPQGGFCKTCGAVTHLKKDCPDLLKTKEDTILTVQTITDSGVESL